MVVSFLPQSRAVGIRLGDAVECEGGHGEGKLESEDGVHDFGRDAPFLGNVGEAGGCSHLDDGPRRRLTEAQ